MVPSNGLVSAVQILMNMGLQLLGAAQARTLQKPTDVLMTKRDMEKAVGLWSCQHPASFSLTS